MLSIPHSPIKVGLLALLYLLVLPAACLALPGQGQGEAQHLTPNHELLFGLAVEGLPDTRQVQTMQKELGLDLDIINVYIQWPAAPDDVQTGSFPTKTAYATAAIDAGLCITWEPMFLQDGEEHAVPATEILAGKWDPYILSFAAKARAWGAPFILRFAHEMNLARYHWGTRAEAYGPQSPGLYRQMFRYMAEKLQAAGASNCILAFCPNAESLPQAPWNRAAQYYPGDDVVELLGMDGYNWGATQNVEEHGWQSQWRDFTDIFHDIHEQLRAISSDKPVLVFETASVRQGGDREHWLADAVSTARTWGLAGLVWFQADKEQQWRLEAGEAKRLSGLLRQAE